MWHGVSNICEWGGVGGRETEREELQNVDYVPVPVRQPLAITWGKSGPLGATFRPAGAFLALA